MTCDCILTVNVGYSLGNNYDMVLRQQHCAILTVFLVFVAQLVFGKYIIMGKDITTGFWL